jgi:DNA-binding CsgD family transcriptional regulator
VAAAAARRPGGPTSTDRLDHAAGPLQAFHARWWRLQTCVAAGDGAGVEAEATALASVDLPHPRLAVLVEAATRWAAVLDGSAGASDVITTAGSLAALGFAWEGATLAGAAALRTTDPEDARALLACGRELRVADQPDEQTDAGPLSEREREVAALVVEGLTHKEIGARLFVSAKTVEHHVAKIRQKLGVTSRAELLAALRGEDSQP